MANHTHHLQWIFAPVHDACRDLSQISWHHWRWHIRLLKGQEFVLVHGLLGFFILTHFVCDRHRKWVCV